MFDIRFKENVSTSSYIIYVEMQGSVWGLTNGCAVEQKSILTHHDWVKILSHNHPIIPYSFVTVNNLLELLGKLDFQSPYNSDSPKYISSRQHYLF